MFDAPVVDIQAFGRQLCSKKYHCECRKMLCRAAAWGKLAHINGWECDEMLLQVNKTEFGGVV
jgi:hypothetical protein